jgi:hypothetical protein
MIDAHKGVKVTLERLGKFPKNLIIKIQKKKNPKSIDPPTRGLGKNLRYPYTPGFSTMRIKIYCLLIVLFPIYLKA